MTTQKIFSRWDSKKVLFECETPEGMEGGLAMRHALEKAVEGRADLRYADLCGANLYGSELSGANLRDANLRDANLCSADLSGSDLRGSNLRGANLSDANLRGANLSDANLSDANLRDANLSGADLRDADLSSFKSDYFDILLRAPNEIAGLRAELVAGRIDGLTYDGECACLVGTIAKVRGTDYASLGNGIIPSVGRQAEIWFMGIKKGDTPETNQQSALAVEWLDELAGLLEIVRKGVAA